MLLQVLIWHHTCISVNTYMSNDRASLASLTIYNNRAPSVAGCPTAVFRRRLPLTARAQLAAPLCATQLRPDRQKMPSTLQSTYLCVATGLRRTG